MKPISIMNLDRRILQRDAGWVRQVIGLSIGALGLLICLFVLFVRSNGNFTGWGAVKATAVCLFAWYVLTRVGTAIGDWVAHLMIGVAEIKRQQEIREAAERAKALAEARKEERPEAGMTRVAAELVRPGMRLARRVAGSDGNEILPNGKELTGEDIRQIKELKIPAVYIQVTQEG